MFSGGMGGNGDGGMLEAALQGMGLGLGAEGGVGKGKDFGKDGGKGCGKDGKGKGAMRLASGEQCYFGKVKIYEVEKARGFICCDEVWGMCGKDIYVHQKVLADSGAGPGDTVAFFLHWSASSGQPQASSPMIRIATPGGYALKGTYKADLTRGHGFMECPETKGFFGRDVYVNKESAATLQAGATLAFNAYLNRDKMPNVEGDKFEAVPPEWEPAPADNSITRNDPTVISGQASKGGAKGAMEGGKGGKDDACGKGGWGEMGKGEGGFGMKGGSGKNGKEMMVYSMMSMMMGMGGGEGGWGKGDGGFGKGKGGGWDGGKGMGKDGGKKGTGNPGGPAPVTTGETYYGVIKSYNDKSQYGFIASQDIQAKYGGVDCFFSGRHLAGCAVGDMIEFDVGLNSKGQPQAITLRPVAGFEPDAKRQKLE